MKKKELLEKKLANKSLNELRVMGKEVKAEWMKLKMDLKVNKLKDVHAARKKRKENAIIETMIREKELSK